MKMGLQHIFLGGRGRILGPAGEKYWGGLKNRHPCYDFSNTYIYLDDIKVQFLKCNAGCLGPMIIRLFNLQELLC